MMNYIVRMTPKQANPLGAYEIERSICATHLEVVKSDHRPTSSQPSLVTVPLCSCVHYNANPNKKSHARNVVDQKGNKS
jgi:hypothetical protein